MLSIPSFHYGDYIEGVMAYSNEVPRASDAGLVTWKWSLVFPLQLLRRTTNLDTNTTMAKDSTTAASSQVQYVTPEYPV
jgi:hypothetical protein